LPRSRSAAGASARVAGPPGPLSGGCGARRELRAGAPAVSEARVIEVLPIETTIGAPGVEEWRDLNRRSRSGTMFLGPEWMEPWWKHFGEGRDLATLCVREGGRLIRVLPLFIEDVTPGGIVVLR